MSASCRFKNRLQTSQATTSPKSFSSQCIRGGKGRSVEVAPAKLNDVTLSCQETNKPAVYLRLERRTNPGLSFTSIILPQLDAGAHVVQSIVCCRYLADKIELTSNSDLNIHSL